MKMMSYVLRCIYMMSLWKHLLVWQPVRAIPDLIWNTGFTTHNVYTCNALRSSLACMKYQKLICGQAPLAKQLKELKSQNGSLRKFNGPKIAFESMVKVPVFAQMWSWHHPWQSQDELVMGLTLQHSTMFCFPVEWGVLLADILACLHCSPAWLYLPRFNPKSRFTWVRNRSICVFRLESGYQSTFDSIISSLLASVSLDMIGWHAPVCRE